MTTPHLLEQNEATGRVANFRRAAGLEEGSFAGPRYNDSDAYKTIETAEQATLTACRPARHEGHPGEG